MTRLATTIKAALVLLLTVIGCSDNSTDPVSSDATLAKSSDASETFGFGSEFGQRALGPIGEVLELSDTQKEQIKTILQQHRESFRGHGREYKKDMSFEERRAQRQAMHASLRDEIFTVLTAEQRAKAEALKAQLDNGQMPEEIIGKRLDRLREKLHLADEQVAQLKALDTWNTLRQGRKNSDGQREFHKQRNAFHEEYEKQMLNILARTANAVCGNEGAEKRTNEATLSQVWSETRTETHRTPDRRTWSGRGSAGAARRNICQSPGELRGGVTAGFGPQKSRSNAASYARQNERS